MKNLVLLILVVLVFPGSCKKAVDDKADLVIEAGYMCGWGAGEDSINISESTVDYVYYIPRESALPQTRTSRNLTESEWSEIINSFNTDNFMELEYNTCNICVDGCDEWISIRNDRLYHKIRFTKDQQIETIKGLQDKLSLLREEFGK
jgi:hypothetical protein